jgi:hypothetical protein
MGLAGMTYMKKETSSGVSFFLNIREVTQCLLFHSIADRAD